MEDRIELKIEELCLENVGGARLRRQFTRALEDVSEVFSHAQDYQGKGGCVTVKVQAEIVLTYDIGTRHVEVTGQVYDKLPRLKAGAQAGLFRDGKLYVEPEGAAAQQILEFKSASEMD